MPRWLGLVDPAQRLEQRVGRGRKGDGVARAGEGAKAQLDQLVAAVADGYPRRLEPEPAGDRFAGGLRGRAGVEPQRVVRRVLDRLDDPRRRRQRRLVGIELHPARAVRRLLARDVGVEALEAPPQDAFRHYEVRRELSAGSLAP